MTTKPDRRAALLDATLQLIGEGGLGAVTHRAVEAAAGLPHGSTTYYFKSRQQLIDAAVERLAEVDHRAVDGMGHGIAMAIARGGELDYDALAGAITAWIRATGPLHLVRYELVLAGARRPEIAERMRDAQDSFVRLLMPIAAAGGSPDAEHDARTLLALLNGLILQELTLPRPGREPTIDPLDLRRIIEAIRPR